MRSELADRFAAVWESQTAPPNVFSYLEQHSTANVDEKLAVVLQDQRRRWNTGRPFTVEQYMDQVPELSREPAWLLELAVGEFYARRTHGKPVDLREFIGRFPGIADTLRERLEGDGTSITLDGVPGYPPIGESGSQEKEARTRSYAVKPSEIAETIGRYRLLRILGEGGFGRVWLAFDSDLQRQVAIKVPSDKRFRDSAQAESFLREARTVARLDHPNIVPVHDVGRGSDGSVYVVSKYIEGMTLAQRMAEKSMSAEQAASLVATVARALQYAHAKRFVHRDIKPSNILLEEVTEQPYVADFGLAAREEDLLSGDIIAGTPSYMSPEQARGEGHRVDSRSDIFSLGVLLYELLTGRRPFRGSTRHEIWHQVITHEPDAPSDYDETIPAELDRICTKALAKRAGDRYATAGELADDLQHWQEGPQQPGQRRPVVPKGLRSFDADDAEFFLELLPGPRDREGLPDSIRFWRNRIETTDADETFTVGLIIGPSGCGKSSLVKAGLLPHLSKDVVSVRIEATPEDTESRLLRGLHKAFPHLSETTDLVELLRTLRHGVEKKKKVVLILDQFEQWLHAHRDDASLELDTALRQCDGAHLQAICMVRDDFAMAASRFMDALDVPIVQGHNFATVDLFDPDHAEKVLTFFGQAFGRLPNRAPLFSDDERQFLRQVTDGLAQDGMVVSVRLALFAEMIKGRPWTPATLDEVGGTEGLGVKFLTETFLASTANPKYRQHERAARQVLKQLLPEVGTDIKGYMQSNADLLIASGYQNRPRDFDELLRILDGELRLITPTDPIGSDTESAADASSRFYQLTHDYLVHSLREWLTRKQKESRRGRAELRLGEFAALWRSSPHRRVLPSWWETLVLGMLTSRSKWSEFERAMMRQASRKYALRGALLCSILLVAAWLGIEGYGITRSNDLIDSLFRAKTTEVPAIIPRMAMYRRWIDSRLQEHFVQLEERRESSQESSPPDDVSRRSLHAALALLEQDPSYKDYLQGRLLDADPTEIAIVLQRLAPHKNAVADHFWSMIDEIPSERDGERLRTACALAAFGADDARWPEIAESVTRAVVEDGPLSTDDWSVLLKPAANWLIDPLTEQFRDASSTPSERVVAARVLAHYARGNTLVELLLDADAAQFQFLLPVIGQAPSSVAEVTDVMKAKLAEPPDGDEEIRAKQAHWQRNAAITLLRLNAGNEVWPILDFCPDPTVRTLLISDMREFGVPVAILLDALQSQSAPVIRHSILLAIEPYGGSQMREDLQRTIVDTATRIVLESRFQTERSSAEWLLDRWGFGDTLHDSASSQASNDGRDWRIGPKGITFVKIPGNVRFMMGSPPNEPSRESHEQHEEMVIAHDFEVSTHEITIRLFHEFRKRFPYARDVSDSEDCPMNKVSSLDAMRFCRWLSEEGGIDEKEMCYPPKKEISEQLVMTDEMLARGGYRLLTDSEWEYVCRAGSETRWFTGVAEEHLQRYAWYSRNSEGELWPVGTLAPNPFGLFDICGNVAEWCHSRRVSAMRPNVVRGGAYHDLSRRLRSAQQTHFSATEGYSFTGFRVARTVRSDAP